MNLAVRCLGMDQARKVGLIGLTRSSMSSLVASQAQEVSVPNEPAVISVLDLESSWLTTSSLLQQVCVLNAAAFNQLITETSLIFYKQKGCEKRSSTLGPTVRAPTTPHVRILGEA